MNVPEGQGEMHALLHDCFEMLGNITVTEKEV
jgi:hypothetical protein